MGTVPGGNNLFSQDWALATAVTVNNLPVNGSTLYVRVWSKINGAFQFLDYTFTAVGMLP